jgi:hypothetical protein
MAVAQCTLSQVDACVMMSISVTYAPLCCLSNGLQVYVSVAVVVALVYVA